MGASVRRGKNDNAVLSISRKHQLHALLYCMVRLG